MSENTAQIPLEEQVATAQAEVTRLAEENAQLRRQLAGQKGQVTRARAALEATKPARPRKFAPLERPLEAAELLALIDDADKVELAFVGPKGLEVAGISPREITGGASAWRSAVNGVRLEVPTLPVAGPPSGQVELAGYALLLDGELAATSRRMDVIAIAPGSHHELKDDVIF